METVKVIIIGIALLIASGIVIAGVVGSNAIAQPRAPVNAPVANTVGGVQEVKLSMNGAQYILEPAVLQPGIPVRMTADMNSVVGCMRTVVIPALGVRKTLSEADNTIEFTPDKPGTYTMTCGMGMGRGSFQVGTGAAPVAASGPVATGGTCGASGGCGCGR